MGNALSSMQIPSDPGALVLASRAQHVEEAAVAVVTVGHDGQGRHAVDSDGRVEGFGHGHEVQVGDAQPGR